MKDEIVVAQALKDQVRIHAASTTALVETARQLHDMYPTSAAALGRTMTVTGILGSTLKDENEHITATINGGGPAGTIMAQADGAGNVRGFAANPQIYLKNGQTGKLDVGKAVGRNGYLRVTRDLGLKEPFTGTVALQSGEIGDDFAYYFAVSEQTPSVVAVGVLVDTDYSIRAAGGVLIQLLPDADEDCVKAVEAIAKDMKPVSQLIDEGRRPEEIIHQLFADARILEHRDIRWHCGCSREHYAAALATLHAQDLTEMIREDRGAEIVCQYCGKKYQYSEAELQQILDRKNHVENR